MKKITKKELVAFAVDFVQMVAGVNENLIFENYFLRGEDFILYLKWIMERLISGDSAEELVEEILTDGFLEPVEEGLAEFRGDRGEHFVGVLACEGTLYSKIYGYSAWREDVYGNGDEAKKLSDGMRDVLYEHGMWDEFGDGDFLLYEDYEEEDE